MTNVCHSSHSPPPKTIDSNFPTNNIFTSHQKMDERAPWDIFISRTPLLWRKFSGNPSGELWTIRNSIPHQIIVTSRSGDVFSLHHEFRVKVPFRNQFRNFITRNWKGKFPPYSTVRWREMGALELGSTTKASLGVEKNIVSRSSTKRGFYVVNEGSVMPEDR